MDNPTVSIGLPIYNGENYMREAIDSVLSQSFKDYEFIISDNGSTDKTREICESYAEKDARIRYFRYEKNMGGSWNFNNVFRLAKGKYFIWVCHDDIWVPDLLKKQVEVLEVFPEVVSCYSRTTFVDENGDYLFSVIGRPDMNIKGPCERFHRILKYHSPTNECSQVLGLFRTDVLKNTPLIGKYPSSDMILLGEIALWGAAYEIPECLLIRRNHPLKSTNAYPSMEERAEWFDPSQKGKIQLSTWKWAYEWHMSVFRSPIGFTEKMGCVNEIWKWSWSYRTSMKKDIKKGIKRLIRNTPSFGEMSTRKIK